MAARFWVGGAGTWNNSSTTNWSATTGGTSGASAPTSADDVTFDALSGSGVVTTAATAAANSITYNSATLTSLTLGAALDISASTSGAVTLTAGTIDLNNFVLTAKTFSSSNTNTRSIAFGTGNITVNGSGASLWNTSTMTGFTYTGTPTVNISNNSATASTVLAGAGAEANVLDFNITTGTYALTLSAIPSLRSLNFTGFTGTYSPGTSSPFLYGNLTLVTGMTFTAGTSEFNFFNTLQDAIITSAGKTLANVTGNTGQIRLNGSLTLNGLFDARTGDLDLTNSGAGNYNLTCATFSMLAGIKTFSFGTANITCTGSGAVWTSTAGNSLTVTGTPTVNISNNSATAATLSVHTSATSPAAMFNFNITTGTYALTIANGSQFKLLNFTGFTGTWAPTTQAVTFFDNLTLVAGMTYTAGTGAWTFAGASGIQDIVTAGKTLGPITINNTGTSVRLQDNFTLNNVTLAFTKGTFNINSKTISGVNALTFATGPSTIQSGTIPCASVTHSSGTVTLDTASTITSTGAYTFTAGTLALGSNTLTTSTFSSSNSNTRAIQFGTGNITTTGSGTAWTTATATNLTYTGTPTVNISNNSATATTVTAGTTGGAETNALGFNFTTGTYALTLTTASRVNSLNFTGFTGSWAPSTATCTFYGSLTLVSGMTFTTGTGLWTFAATSGTQTITSAGKTLYSITQSGVGGTVALGDATTLSNTYTLTNGTFDASNINFTALTFSSSNSNTRTITMGSGTWTLSGTGTVWNTATITNLTLNQNTSTILLSDTSTTARTFAGGGKTYYNFTIGGATGTSTLTITGANTFNILASTKTIAHTIIFPNVTTTVSDWTITGTVGNVVTLQRTGGSGTFTLAKSSGGIISTVDYLSISNSTATPSGRWYAGANSTDGGGNTGWVFSVYVPSSSNFFLFM